MPAATDPPGAQNSILPAALPGAFPPPGKLSPENKRAGAYRRELKEGFAPPRRFRELQLKLARIYALRSRYFESLAGGLPDRAALRRMRRKKRTRSDAGPEAPRRTGWHKPRCRQDALHKARKYYRAAHSYYRKFLARAKGSGRQERVLYEAAALYLERQQQRRAVKLMQQLVAHAPSSPNGLSARLYLAAWHFEGGRCAQVEKMLAGVRLDSAGALGAIGAFCVGSCAMQRKDYGQALAWLRKSFALVNEADGVLWKAVIGQPAYERLLGEGTQRLAEAYLRAGTPQAAVGWASRVKKPVGTRMLVFLVYGYLKAGMAREAALVCRAAQQFLPRSMQRVTRAAPSGKDGRNKRPDNPS
jgi:tetratricopeptide (TPR) repeat protein